MNDRNDLTYIIGELIGELNNGHAYVAGGERPETPRIKLGLLGAELSRDPASKAYRIDKILPGENWDKENRSPLTAIGLNLKAGRLHPGGQWHAGLIPREHLRRPHRHGRQTGHPAGELHAERERRARHHCRPDGG